jgi:integrase
MAEAGETTGRRGPNNFIDLLSIGDESFDFSGISSPTSKRGWNLSGLEILQPLAILLYHAIDACVAARLQSTSERNLRPAAENPRQLDGRVCRQVAEIVAQLLVSKQADGLSRRYIESVRSHLVRFATAFQTDINLITAPQIDAWLREQEIGPRARNNFRGSIITLFHFARKHGHLPKGQPTEADDIAKAKDFGAQIGILRPAELALILRQAPERIRLFLALGAFTGMRSSEILRLDWKDVNFERSFITISPEKAKTATRRLVPTQPNLMRWLAPYRKHTGAVFKTPRDAGRAIAFAKDCHVKWPNNALRHSYATYRLAVTADAARVALEMGNSPQKLMTNYRELADEKEGQEWFGIFPDQPL